MNHVHVVAEKNLSFAVGVREIHIRKQNYKFRYFKNIIFKSLKIHINKDFKTFLL